MATQQQIEMLAPNALLILSAIDALNGPGVTSSPKSDTVGWALGHDAPWVHRHGAGLEDCGLATLSRNGHCFLSAEGVALARRLRVDEEAVPPPPACGCGAEEAGPCVHGRQMYGCGCVVQWCPDHVPGLPRAEVGPRSRRAQHEGTWFGATYCGRALARHGRPPSRDATFDGTPLVSGLPVTASYGSGAHGMLAGVQGTVLAAAGGYALVSWPATPRRPAVEADIMRASQLVLDGALDFSGLSEYQEAVIAAAHRGEAVFELQEDGTWSGRMGGRVVNQRTMALLAGRGLLPGQMPEEAPAPAPR